ncbi:MAG: PilZ domain-containing protein [Acidobacteriia bacterium]|nr:PilZ domain-containing protein [Terriglobia bacterium]
MNRSMDCRRREPRFEIDQPVTVTNLEQPGIPQLGRLANFSAKGTRMILAHELTPGTMVKVEWGGTVLLGEIIYCAPHGSEFAVGLELEDVLYEKHMFASMSESWAALLQARR